MRTIATQTKSFPGNRGSVGERHDRVWAVSPLRPPGAPTGTRTLTGPILSRLPLPIGLWGPEVILRAVPPPHRQDTTPAGTVAPHRWSGSASVADRGHITPGGLPKDVHGKGCAYELGNPHAHRPGAVRARLPGLLQVPRQTRVCAERELHHARARNARRRGLRPHE